MARMLSNIEYVTFLDEVMPDSITDMPPWGAVIKWGDQYVLVFHMASGEWALTDITDGVPYGNAIIPVQQYIGQVPAQNISWADAFWFSLPSNAMQVALEGAAKLQQLGTQTLQVTAQQVADAFQKLLEGASKGLGASIWPIAAGLVALAFILYGKK